MYVSQYFMSKTYSMSSLIFRVLHFTLTLNRSSDLSLENSYVDFKSKNEGLHINDGSRAVELGLMVVVII